MRVGTRITVATGAVVAVTLMVYAFYDVRTREAARRLAAEREGRSVATALRASLEATNPDAIRNAPLELGRDLSKAGSGWRVAVVPRELADNPDAVLPPGISPIQVKRLRTLVDVPRLTLVVREDNRLVYGQALRRRSAAAVDGVDVTGMLEVSRSLAYLDDDAEDDIISATVIVFAITALTTFAVGILTQSLMTRPFGNLLSGIDDVAKGDLSRVLLSERDDEIGAIATRFNEMTFSLRESRGETQRQNEAKLALEQRLAQTEKLATIGQIAAEIAHEVGTPLNVIAGRARATQRKCDEPQAVAKNAQIIAEQTARITRIIQRLLDFARRKVGAVERSPIGLNEMAVTTMELLGGQFANARVKTTLVRAEKLPVVLGDADRLQQVLLNLLLNAIQAMPDGGTLRVETSVHTRQRPGLELAPEQTFVCVELADTGQGIPPDIRDKIFEPFYTSKEGQGGTGLGLAVCSGIVKEHDGWIDVDDRPHGGTVFRVFLPAEPPASA